MSEAAPKSPPTTRLDIAKKFREEFGRDLTQDKKRLLGWSDSLIEAKGMPDKKLA